MAAYHSIAYKILFLAVYIFRNIFISYYAKTFLVGVQGFGVTFPKLKTFSGIFWILPVHCSLYEKATLEI